MSSHCRYNRFVLVERATEFKLEFIYLILRKWCALILFSICEMHPLFSTKQINSKTLFYLLNFSRKLLWRDHYKYCAKQIGRTFYEELICLTYPHHLPFLSSFNIIVIIAFSFFYVDARWQNSLSNDFRCWFLFCIFIQTTLSLLLVTVCVFLHLWKLNCVFICVRACLSVYVCEILAYNCFIAGYEFILR